MPIANRHKRRSHEPALRSTVRYQYSKPTEFVKLLMLEASIKSQNMAINKAILGYLKTPS